MNLWDEDFEEDQQQTQQVETNKKYESDGENDKPKVLKSKDQKILDLIKEQAKKIKANLESNNFGQIIQIYENLVNLYPQINELFVEKDKKIPNIFLKSIYLIRKSTEQLDEETKKKFKNLLTKLKIAMESINEDLKTAIEEYKQEKVSDDELDFNEELTDHEDIKQEEKKEKDENEVYNIVYSIISKISSPDDPNVKRLKWMKKEYLMMLPEYQNYIEERKEISPLTNIKSTATGEVEEDNYGKTTNQKIENIIKRLNKEERAERLSDEEIEKEYKDKASFLNNSQNRNLEVIERLYYLVNCSTNSELKIKLHILILSSHFELSIGGKNELNLNVWNDVFFSLDILNTLSKEAYSNKTKDELTEALSIFQGSIVSLLERLQVELYKCLQLAETESNEYTSLKQFDTKLTILCFQYHNNPVFLLENNKTLRSRISFLIILQVYYKKISKIDVILTDSKSVSYKSDELIKIATSSIYENLDNKVKIKTYLCEIYYHANNNNFKLAHTLFKKTNLPHYVTHYKDDNIKLIYNRVLIQLGLSAFRSGEFELSKYYFSPLCSLGTSRMRDNICQTIEKLSNLDKKERRKFIPGFMSINLDDVEQAFYISILLEDIDKVLLSRLGIEKSNIYLRRQLDSYQKQV